MPPPAPSLSTNRPVASRSMSVLVLGGTGIDTVVPVAGLPVLGADSARPTGPIHDDVSHTGTCVALALRALGVPVALADAIGDDDAGRRVTSAFADWGIPLHAALSPAGTRRAVNLKPRRPPPVDL